jgi:GNAT superfamily N-acetyltransferase
MDEEYRVALVDEPDDAAITVVGCGIRDYNELRAGRDSHKRLCLFLYSPDESVVGGLIGSTYWDWLYVSLLWVREDLRGGGHGHRLLALAEDEARQRGAKNAYLDTFSFQGPDFYLRQGYRVFGQLDDFPEGHQRYFLTKRL